MKKILLLISLAIIVVANLNAQTVPNGGFENWQIEHYYDEPNFGTTSNLQAFYTTQAGNVQKSSDAFAGNFAARLSTVSNATDTIPGIIFLGVPNGSFLDGGLPINVRPDSLKCFAKFNIQPNDTANILIAFKKFGIANPIGVVQLTFTGMQNSYQAYASKIIWSDSITVPDTLVGFMVSSSINQSGAIPGSELFLDNVGFTGAVGAPSTDFETWNAVQSLEPDGWWTPNFVLINQTPCVTQSTDAHSGQYAMRIENVLSDFGDTLGFATNGYFGVNDFMGGMAVMQNPVKVSGYYKYTPVGNDTALVGIFTAKFNTTLGYSERLDSGLVKLPAAANYTYFEVPLYYNGWPIADSLNITFASGNFQNDSLLLVPGSVLLVDDIEVFYNPVSVKDFSFENDLIVFPNPAQNILYIKLKNSTNNQMFKLFDAKGRLIFEGNCHYLDGTVASLDISEVPSGFYFYQIINENSIQKGKINIQK
jgi:hypothetical protein